MGLTAFGLVYLPLLLAVVLFARQWLPALVIFSTCIQAASVVNVPVGESQFGITPYNATALAAFCVLLLHLWQQRQQPIRPKDYRYPKLAFWLLATYVVVAAAGAFVLPHLFEGQMVNLLSDPDGFAHRRLLPLTFTLSNPVQVANLLIHIIVLLYLLQASHRGDWNKNSLILGILGGALLVVAVGFYERIADVMAWTGTADFWASNPGYQQAHSSRLWGIRRIAVPFSEPSYTSTFLAAISVASLAVLAFGKNRIIAAMAAILCSVALANTTGMTGLAASGLGMTAILIWATWRSWKTPSLRKIVALLWISCVSGAYFLYSKFPQLVELTVDRLTLQRPQTVRLAADKQAVTVFQETWGLGAGLGSNRAASFMASLFSNTGLLGGLLFVATLMALWRGYMRHKNLTDVQLFTAVGLAGATLAMSIGIPDLNMPMYWGFIFLAFLYSPITQRERSPTNR